jgi:hypothetical protein
MKHSFARCCSRVALIAAVPLSAGAADLDALDLQVEPDSVTAATGPRVFLEGSVGRAEQRYGLGSRSIGRMALDARHAMRLSPSWQAVGSARLDASRPEDPRIDNPVFSLREAYLGWQGETAMSAIEIGRINLREGPGYGYNPTDFFRDNALRTISTQNPFSLRENRLGAVMVRAQHTWDGGALAVAWAPKLEGGRSDKRFSPDWGATNASSRGLVSLGTRWSERANTQLSVYKEDGTSARVGLSGSLLVSDAAVAHAEWTYSRERDLLSRALQLPSDERGRQRAVAGLTYTTATKLSLTAEAQHNGFALDRSGWQALPGLPAQSAYFAQAVALQDNAARHALMLYAVQRDLLTRNLDLTLLARFNRTDRSRLTWAELRYRMDRADLALQWQDNRGVAGSEYGLAPIRRSVSVVGVVHF